MTNTASEVSKAENRNDKVPVFLKEGPSAALLGGWGVGVEMKDSGTGHDGTDDPLTLGYQPV